MTDTPRINLKPCPFCGSGSLSMEWEMSSGAIDQYAVKCGFCKAFGPMGYGKDGAARRWNIRADALTLADCVAVPEVRELVEVARIVDDAVKEGHENLQDLFFHLLSAAEPARDALRKLEGGAE